MIGRMVAADGFSHALTTLLPAPAVFNESTFPPRGMVHPGAAAGEEYPAAAAPTE